MTTYEDTYDFTTPRVDERGRVVARVPGTARRCWEDLGGGVRLALVALPGGRFVMGSPPGQGYADEHPPHPVTLAPFWLGQYPVTQAQWLAVMGRPLPFRGQGSGNPADNVSWHDAVAFCRRLAAATGRAYALPTEAQWEYACRGPEPPAAAAGGPPFAFGENLTSDLANYVGEVTYRGGPPGIYRHGITAAGSFPPNGFGLHDMHGNVWEWCADLWHDNYRAAPADGSAWLAGADERYRVARGGSWHDGPDLCRSAARLRLLAAEGEDFIGFRVACPAGQGDGEAPP